MALTLIREPEWVEFHESVSLSMDKNLGFIRNSKV